MNLGVYMLLYIPQCHHSVPPVPCPLDMAWKRFLELALPLRSLMFLPPFRMGTNSHITGQLLRESRGVETGSGGVRPVRAERRNS